MKGSSGEFSGNGGCPWLPPFVDDPREHRENGEKERR